MSVQTTIPRATPAVPSAAVPPLQNGDRLTVAEFRRRYEAMPHLKRADLIDGVVFMPSPVSHQWHGVPHAHVVGWLFIYHAHTPGTQAGDNSSLRELDLHSEPQADVNLRILPTHGGQSRTDAAGYIIGPPELVVEVAASSANYDLHDKLDLYRRSGIREYVVWRVWDQAIDWFVLRDGRYDPLPPSAEGPYRSEVFPGLWLDAAALLRGDLARVLQVAQEGINSPEHAAFVERLQAIGG
jgi:Uma2 family endonuclease